jgi:hypothetical protein
MVEVPGELIKAKRKSSVRSDLKVNPHTGRQGVKGVRLVLELDDFYLRTL